MYTYIHTYTYTDTYIYSYLYVYAYIVFANSPGDRSSIPGWVIPKTQKMVLVTSLFNTQHYKVWIKGKSSNPGKWVMLFSTPWCSSYWKGSFRGTLDYSRLILYTHTHTHTYIYTHPYICIYTYLYTYPLTYIYVHIRIFTHTHTHTHTHTYIFIYIHAQT